MTQGRLPSSAFLWASGSFPLLQTPPESGLSPVGCRCVLPAGSGSSADQPRSPPGPQLRSPLRAEPRGRPFYGLPPPPASLRAPAGPGAPLPPRRGRSPARREPGGEQSLRAVPAGRPAATGRRRAPVLPPARSVFTAAAAGLSRPRVSHDGAVPLRPPGSPAPPADCSPLW